MFDAGLFGFTPREAALLDPQLRLMLECSWEALEDAGHAPDRFDGAIGMYAGVGAAGYVMKHILPDMGRRDAAAGYQAIITNDKDFLTTWVAYKLDLKGPCVTIQTACSTSLVAVHEACQSLLTYQCDMALAGGVSVSVDQGTGYLFQEGSIFSPDGHCRAFDAEARGTVSGSGAGVVLLRRLKDALDDGDPIYAVIRGSAINNDGSDKVGFTAPSVSGQSQAISMALAVAGVEPDTVATSRPTVREPRSETR